MGLLSFTALTLHNNQLKNNSNSTNDSLNSTINDSADNTTNTSTTQKTSQTTKKTTSSSKSSGSSQSQEDEWVYGHGAGSSDDLDIQWKRNKKTGYTEYYNTKTHQSWGGYDIA